MHCRCDVTNLTWFVKIVIGTSNFTFNQQDLGYLDYIQALQQRLESVENLVNAFQSSYNALEPAPLEKTFMTRCRVMNAVIECNGDNCFKIPRSKKTEEDLRALEDE